MKYRPDIDGLRAVAVLSVVSCHVGLGVTGGYVGVDVFFVISGYLITCLMVKDLDAGTFSLADFWERRIRRILPALFVVVAASTILGWFLLVPKSYQLFGRSVVKLALIRANIHFSRDLAGYFTDASESKPLLHTWSLAVEEQFYLFIPIFFWVAHRFRQRKALEVVVAGGLLVSFVAATVSTFSGSSTAYFLLPTRAWELLVGVAMAMYASNVTIRSATLCNLAAALGIAGIIVPCFLYDSNTPFPGPAAAPPVLGAMLLILTGLNTSRPTWVHQLLASRPLAACGLVSYSLYLWHWPLFVFYKYPKVKPLAAYEKWLLIAVAFVLAAATYYLIEQPFRRRDFLPRRRQWIGAAAAAFGLLIGGGQWIYSNEGVFQRLPAQALTYARTSTLDRRFHRDMTTADVPGRLIRLGTDTAEPELLVWGDSHAMAILPAIDDVCRRQGIAAVGAVHSASAPVVDNPSGHSEGVALNEAVLLHLKTSKIRNVLLAGFWQHYGADPRFHKSLLETVDTLQRLGMNVYFMRDVPAYDFDVGVLVTRYDWDGRDPAELHQTLREYDADNRFFNEISSHLVARGVVILDPIPLLRSSPDANVLQSFDAGGCFYIDENHLSHYGARRISPIFEPLAEGIRSTKPLSVAERDTVIAPDTPIRR